MIVVNRQPPSHGLTTPVGRFRGPHALTLIVNTRGNSRLTGCVCLHALSSFQRTDRSCARGARPTVFGVSGACVLAGIEPATPGPTAWVSPNRPHRMSDAARLGEPSEVT